MGEASPWLSSPVAGTEVPEPAEGPPPPLLRGHPLKTPIPSSIPFLLKTLNEILYFFAIFIRFFIMVLFAIPTSKMFNAHLDAVIEFLQSKKVSVPKEGEMLVI